MPLIRFKYAHPDGTPATGTVHATPTRRHHRGDRVILPAPLTIEVDSTGEATADLAPTGDTWVWEFREHMNLPHPAVVYKMVPDQTVSLDFTDLVEVDPRSLQETATPEARWWAELRANNATAAEVRDIRDLVLPARDETLAARDQTLAHGITVDTSVGTRVFVGDTMIHGDTGWVDISGSLHEDWELSGLEGIFQIKRENSTVTLVARVTRAPDSPTYATDSSLIDLLNTDRSVLPRGFRPFPQYGLYASVQPKDGIAVYLSALSSQNNLRLYSDSSTGTWAPGDSLRFQTSWQTDDVWPT